MSSTDFGTTEARPVPLRQPQASSPARRVVRKESRNTSAPTNDARFFAQPLTPWWFSIPSVLRASFKIATAPLVLAVMVAELIMAALILGVAGLIGAWWMGWITDTQILEAAKPVGDRLMAIIQSLGYL